MTPLTAVLSTVRQVAVRWVKHDNPRSAAAIAFYAIFTIAPLLVFATAGLGLVVGEQRAESLTEERLSEIIGPSGAKVAREVLDSADFSRSGYLPTLLTTGLLVFGASATFYQLRRTLDRILGAREKREGRRAAVVATLLDRLIATCFVVASTAFLVATLVAQVVLRWVSRFDPFETGLTEPLWRAASVALSLAIVSLGAFVLLRRLPSRTPAWRDALLGAGVIVVLFELGRWLIGWYLSSAMIASVYGPSGAIVAFIIWIYYTAQTVILGAEVCQLSAERRNAS